MSARYSFDTQQDFPNQRVSLETLFEQIQKSGIRGVLKYVIQNDFYCDIVFEEKLLETDYQILLNIIYSHIVEELVESNTPPVVHDGTEPFQTQTYFEMIADGTSNGVYWRYYPANVFETI